MTSRFACIEESSDVLVAHFKLFSLSKSERMFAVKSPADSLVVFTLKAHHRKPLVHKSSQSSQKFKRA